jgi:hypothetical protein
MRAQLRVQMDLYRHGDPAAVARAHRLAADTARRNPFETPEAAEQRARYYERRAETLERQAETLERQVHA